MMQFVQAGAEDFIWLIVGAFWIIAQIAGAAAKNKAAGSRRRNPQTQRETPADDPFAELMRQINGGQAFEQPKPEFEPELESQNTWQPGEIEALPDIRPSQRVVVPEPPAPATIEMPEEDIEVDLRPTMSSFKTAMPLMKLPALSMSFQTSEKSPGKVPSIGNIINPADRQTLRRAILGQIVLSPPKALE